MAKKNNKIKSTITYTPGRYYRVKLRGRIQSKGLISLYLDYYLGVTKTSDGQSQGERKIEYLNIYLKENPQNVEERETNKNRLELAKKIREKSEERFMSAEHGLPNPHRKKINFVDYFQNFLDEYKNKDIRLVKNCLSYFKKYVDDRYITPIEITEDFAENFKKYLQDKLNGETPYNYFSKFKKVCRQATKDRLFDNNPTDGISITRPTGVKKEILSFDEIEQLAKAECGNTQVKLTFLFCLNTGLRLVDAKKLMWKDIDNYKIKIQQTKVKNTSSKSVINIDLNNNARAILSLLDKGKPNEYVFSLPSFTGSLKTLKNWVKRAGIEKNITWHSARHSFATNLLFSNTDIKTVSGLLGHSDLKHTQKYTHLVDELKRKAVESLPDTNIKV